MLEKFRANVLKCHYDQILDIHFIPRGIFWNMHITSFSSIFNQELEQGKLMAAVDSQK